jgi:glutamate--cysteine ligase
MKTQEKEQFRHYLDGKLFTPPIGIDKELIGIELESFAHNSKTKQPAQIFEGKECITRSIIDASDDFFGERHTSNYGNEIITKINFNDGDKISFEPGGQIEIITKPCSNFIELNNHLKSKQDLLDKVAKETNTSFIQYGTNPWYSPKEIGQQLKLDRYESMFKYFEGISPYGKQMMLQTCSMHVNLDLGIDELTKIKRYVAANLLAPFTTAIFANSSIIEGKTTKYQSYRNLIWQHLDPLRTGILPLEKIIKTWNKEDVIDAYLDFALSAPIIYTKDSSGQVFPSNQNMNNWLSNPINGRSPDYLDYDQHLSLLFPSVRLKGYLEIRSLDAPPLEWQLVPAIFYSGLLYSNEFLDKTIDLLLPTLKELPKNQAESLHGLESDHIYSISKKLMKFAIDGFSSLPETLKDENSLNQLIAFAEQFTFQRKTFAQVNHDRF